jgi:hypothetical protein
MGHNFVGTRTTFIRCYWTKTWNWARALKKVKVTLKKLVKRLNYTLVEGLAVASEIPFTRAKSVRNGPRGKDLGQNFVGTEHILISLLLGQMVFMRTLDKLNVDIHKLRNLILTYIEETQEEILRPLTQAEKILVRA